MIDPNNTLDPNGLASLKRLAHENSPAAVKQVAQQFEALFMQMVLKSMRDATPSDGMFDSDATRFYQSMSDQQMATLLAQRGGFGLAKALEKQLSGQVSLQPANSDLHMTTTAPGMQEAPASGAVVPPTAQPAKGNTDNAPQSAAQTNDKTAGLTNQDFVNTLWPQAAEAAQSLGVPAHFLVGQAALESGWGRSEIRNADGSPSYNLFNLKAGPGWNGKTVEATTTEYANGVAQTRVERFRAYGSYAEAFQDYASLIRQSPRYAEALGQTDAQGFARALQNGGYATDPAYADKLTRVINGNTLRQTLVASLGA